MLKKSRYIGILYFGIAFLLAWGGFISHVKAATLSTSPASGTFTVGSTFDVSIYLNTEDQSVNAINTALSFPPDKLQLVSPSTGKSVIGVWTAQPTVNNQIGKVELQGGVPGGIKVGNGLVTTLTFRVKSVGTATIKFLDNSKVLLHDGRGTDVLSNTSSGIYQLVLPPPAGPVVVSQTHPDQTLWYSGKTVTLSWSAEEKVAGYSYEISQDPVGIPDDTQDSDKSSVTYRNLSDNIYYFHIKALSGGSWGGTTHFAIKIDSDPPADFPLKVIPSARTVRKQPIFEFQTTDKNSGINHYELKLVNLKEGGEQPLFVETVSPYVPQELSPGEYLVLVRVYDNAGNIREVSQKLEIITSAFQIVGSEGMYFGEKIFIAWKWFWLVALMVLLGLFFIFKRIKFLHQNVEQKRSENHLPDNLKKQLEELKKYKSKFGTLVVFGLMVSSFILGMGKAVEAADSLSTPVVNILSKELSNKEIFYVGGRVEIPETEVSVYLQNTETQETYTFESKPDKFGEWFYRHESFLPSGNYVVWVQGKLQSAQSAPSGQLNVLVKKQAFQIAGSRLSYELVYLVFVITLVLVVLILFVSILYHSRQLRKKRALLNQEIRQAEESIKRGFAVIRRDIEQELSLLKKSKGKPTKEEKEKESQLIKDLAEIEGRLEKEIWEMGET
ncbi:MAG: hypothetical protein JNN11_03050 [Candidatus Doudnabacteria bacterium]|nr:hypothetical protein [Candidatus Doudnabacteria bacterium]